MNDIVPVQRVFIAGAGHMGHGIAQVAATAGVAVTLFDVCADSLVAAMQKMEWSLGKLHEKGKINPRETPEVVLGRIRTTTDLSAAAGAELVIEAIPERESLKRELFAKLDAICPPSVMFTSNTSAIPITNLAAATRRPECFCGTHFFGPVPMMALVEVIRGLKTNDETTARAMAFVKQIGKQPVLVKRDVAGFIVNRVLGAAMAEAARLVESGLADVDDVDRAMRLGCNWKMGPLETADLAGLDVALHMFEAMQQNDPNPALAPPPILKRLVAAGDLGRKTGRGFYEYLEQRIPNPSPWKGGGFLTTPPRKGGG